MHYTRGFPVYWPHLGLPHSLLGLTLASCPWSKRLVGRGTSYALIPNDVIDYLYFEEWGLWWPEICTVALRPFNKMIMLHRRRVTRLPQQLFQLPHLHLFVFAPYHVWRSPCCRLARLSGWYPSALWLPAPCFILQRWWCRLLLDWWVAKGSREL